jgi:uncharacterized membrane protein
LLRNPRNLVAGRHEPSWLLGIAWWCAAPLGHGAAAAPMVAIGTLSGYCGTLMTPMAANFNLVPAALLELKDPHGGIRAQVGTAILLLVCNLILLYFMPFL